MASLQRLSTGSLTTTWSRQCCHVVQTGLQGYQCSLTVSSLSLSFFPYSVRAKALSYLALAASSDNPELIAAVKKAVFTLTAVDPLVAPPTSEHYSVHTFVNIYMYMYKCVLCTVSLQMPMHYFA